MKRILAILLCFALILAGCGAKKPEPTESKETESVTVPATTQAPTEEPTTVPTETEPPVPETVSGTALADHTDVVLMTVDRDSTVEIAGEYDDVYYIVKTEQGYGLMEKRLIRLEGAEAYEQWSGYAVYNAKVYNNYHLLPDDVQTLNMNAQVKVLDSLGGYLVVQVEETVGYMRESEVSRYYINPAPAGGGNTGGADGGDISLRNQGGIIGLYTFVPQSGEVTGKGTVLVNGAEIILGWFDRENSVAIINEEGFAEAKEGWYAVYHDGLYGYVRQSLILKDDEEAYTEWDGFAKYQAPLYDNYYLTGEAVSKLTANASVHILADLGNCYLVTSAETTGYMAKDQVSDTYISYGGGGGGGNTGGDWTPPAL